jgi:hypothetical protein
VAMPQPDPPASTTLVHCVDDLLASVRDAREPRCDVRFAREVVRIIEAAERALA